MELLWDICRGEEMNMGFNLKITYDWFLDEYDFYIYSTKRKIYITHKEADLIYFANGDNISHIHTNGRNYISMGRKS
jgi:hypothetical protein